MTIELRVPHVGESIQEVQIGRWLKQAGDEVQEDENVVELETDKASMEVPAPSAGVLARIVKQEGEAVSVGDVIAYLEEEDGANRKADSRSAAARQSDDARSRTAEGDATSGDATGGNAGRKRADGKDASLVGGSGSAPAASARDSAAEEARDKEHAPPGDSGEREDDEKKSRSKVAGQQPSREADVPATPSARRALREHGLRAGDVAAQGSHLRSCVVRRHVEKKSAATDDDKPAE
jgi:2-oxoglutarate dehydrogenase E2 component (dihydrolipoamide succinyltransferase)